MKVCHRCHSPWRDPGPPGFNNTCAKCGISVHACGNCAYYLRSGPVRCTVPDASRILDWQAGNRCKHFEFQDVSIAVAEAVPTVHANGNGPSARDRWNQLFSK
jgi:hypothetical protein